MTKHARFSLLPSFIIFSAALLAGCNDQGDTQAHAGEPQVTVHVVETAPLAVTTELPGRTSAFRIAEVRPQVSGIVLKRNFTEGSDVEAGQSLYQIDPATYQADYDSAKGELAKSEAAAAIAHLTVKRYVHWSAQNISANRNMIRRLPTPARPMPPLWRQKPLLKARVLTLRIPKSPHPSAGV